MTNSVAERVWSDLPVPPGEVLSEELEALGMTQKDLAAALGRPQQVVNEIIRAKKAITEETALELERVLGIGAHVWLGVETTYRLTLARNRERERLLQAEGWLSEFPINDMVKRGWIPKVRDTEERVRALLNFFGVASVAAYRQTPVVGFRFSEKAKASPGALAAWLRKGELAARDVETRSFNAEALLAAAHEARALTNASPDVFQPQLERILGEAGVAFAVVPELPKTGANGAARWLNRKKALIQLNIRHKWADIFWFSLFHEVAHLLLHRSHGIMVDAEGVTGDPAVEAEADRWARDFLIAPDAWDEFVGEQEFTKPAVRAFAKAAGVSTSIVVGRLQKEKFVPYSALTGLKDRFAWRDPDSA